MKKPKITVSYEVDKEGKVISKTTTKQYDTSPKSKDTIITGIALAFVALGLIAATIKLVILITELLILM